MRKIGEDLYIGYITPYSAKDKKDKQVKYESEEYSVVTRHLNCRQNRPIADHILEERWGEM